MKINLPRTGGPANLRKRAQYAIQIANNERGAPPATRFKLAAPNAHSNYLNNNQVITFNRDEKTQFNYTMQIERPQYFGVYGPLHKKTNKPLEIIIEEYWADSEGRITKAGKYVIDRDGKKKKIE
ncbi:Hypothetical protein IALB_1783 [Ignavibacterium album JCM 16511]|uniref:Uncharacterized protein n=1 Tax=Ignavibacterium album (strain DSM 19864 / JCM 16511 / NBRC 101810 / Mat9-16) TaxID=945713 RepID=I0AKI3_IGNAJ|nr:hypothetical protein [Ignavibacterium album]AFH49490.1 Hypothetical protein IALB_1783 [Ignavibacterium album JCM 16511]